MNFIFHFIYGMSSFPLTNSIINFSEGFCSKPPTSIYIYILIYIYIIYIMERSTMLFSWVNPLFRLGHVLCRFMENGCSDRITFDWCQASDPRILGGPVNQDTLWLWLNSYWTWPIEIVDLAMKNGDFPISYVKVFTRGYLWKINEHHIFSINCWYF